MIHKVAGAPPPQTEEPQKCCRRRSRLPPIFQNVHMVSHVLAETDSEILFEGGAPAKLTRERDAREREALVPDALSGSTAERPHPRLPISEPSSFCFAPPQLDHNNKSCKSLSNPTETAALSRFLEHLFGLHPASLSLD